LILLPLTPVVQYLINNQDILSPLGAFYVLGVFGVFSIFFILLAPTLLSLIGSSNALMIMGLTFTFSITNMAAVSSRLHWLERGDLTIQLVIFSSTFLVLTLLYNLAGRKFTYYAVALFFLANSASQIAAEVQEQEINVTEGDSSTLLDIVKSGEPSSTPNIYLLVYDAYVANETMREYGIDNREQEHYLEDSGFQLYPHTYSIAGFTIGTMGRTLNASTGLSGSFRKSVSGDGNVHKLLKRFGYETVGVFYGDFFFQGIGTSYDQSFPSMKPTHKLLMKAIFMGEFRFDVEFDKATRDQFEEKKSEEFTRLPANPRFIYMHDELPGHSQNSGECRPNETDQFRDRLEQANIVMKKDLGQLVRNDPGAIIIVAGDHGPYLTKNCTGTGENYDISEITRLDVQDRFGTFLAIRWPEGTPSKYDQISILQDLFPSIFAFIMEDAKVLESRVESLTLGIEATSGVSVENGIIKGGVHDGEPLFLD
jgi:hypothetical protein